VFTFYILSSLLIINYRSKRRGISENFFQISKESFKISPERIVVWYGYTQQDQCNRGWGSLLRRHRLSIFRQNFLQAKKLIAAMPAKTRRVWTSYVTLVDRLCYPHPHGINLFISKLLQNVKSCVAPTPIGYDIFIFRHNSKKYQSRISFLYCKLLQIWMKYWLFCTYNGWPEFNEIQMVKPRQNLCKRIERQSVKCEWNL
jgi:hypothetical protein